MKRLPESELEIMMIIWKYNRPVNRMEIEEHLKKDVAAPTILSFLNRLETKGFVSVEKIGKINWYTPLVKKEEYLQKESRNILRRMYQNSLKNFVTALYDGEGLSSQDLEDLKAFIEEKGPNTRTE
ncbi:MAG: BlaI/MecI/CopY family transcriptional regulator [Lachnospiraceae bacterium]|nr:BlaI/MecI/CopY family transcriptional regulator [Lachnospiraceae bacterium]